MGKLSIVIGNIFPATIIVLKRIIRFGVVGECPAQGDFRKQFGPKGSVFPVGGYVFVPGDEGIDRVLLTQTEGLGQGQTESVLRPAKTGRQNRNEKQYPRWNFHGVVRFIRFVALRKEESPRLSVQDRVRLQWRLQ